MGYSEVIREALKRKGAGWTQQRLADEVGVQQPTVQRWLAGARAPEPDTIPTLARVLEVEPYLLLDLDYGSLGLAPSVEVEMDAEIVKHYSGFSREQKEAMVEMARRIGRLGGSAGG